MHFARFKGSWSAARRENATKNMLVAVLIVTNLIAVLGWFRTRETVVLVPPTLDERVTVSADAASDGYKKAWALYVAELLGNVSPGNADFILAAVEGIMAPSAYRTLKAALARQIQDIKVDSLTVSFEPRQVTHEIETNKVFVYGRFQAEGPSGDPRSFMRTYEMKVAMRFGRPWVTHLEPYAGVPRTVAYLQTQVARGERP